MWQQPAPDYTTIKMKGGEALVRGDPQAIAGRPLAVSRGRPWAAWIARMSEKRRRDREARLETIDRLGAEARSTLRAGEYKPNLKFDRRWS